MFKIINTILILFLVLLNPIMVNAEVDVDLDSEKEIQIAVERLANYIRANDKTTIKDLFIYEAQQEYKDLFNSQINNVTEFKYNIYSIKPEDNNFVVIIQLDLSKKDLNLTKYPIGIRYTKENQKLLIKNTDLFKKIEPSYHFKTSENKLGNILQNSNQLLITIILIFILTVGLTLYYNLIYRKAQKK